MGGVIGASSAEWAGPSAASATFSGSRSIGRRLEVTEALSNTEAEAVGTAVGELFEYNLKGSRS
jgi:hypothetical protein